MRELQGIGRFKFQEGKLEEFKRLSAQAMEIVRAKDSGTLQYELLGEPRAELKAMLAGGAIRRFTPFLSM